jgi:hypothetical protein
MKLLFTTLFITLFITSQFIYSQESRSVDKWMEYIDDLSSSGVSQEAIESLQAELSFLASHPMDINKVTVENLLKFPFIDDFQASAIIEYRNKNGSFLTLYELKNIPSLDFETVQLLLSFIYVGDDNVDKSDFSVNNMFKNSNNELYIRYDMCFQQKAGYSSYPDSVLEKYPNRVYVGEPFYTSLRYSFSYKDKMYASFVAEKDAGESFAKGERNGFDFYSANILLKDVSKWLKTVAVGDYKLSFGQGLVVSNDFFINRTSMVTQLEKRNNGIRRHYSTSETNFFRGAASAFSFGMVDLSLFYSHRRVDGNVKDGDILSFKTDGLHRTQLDLAKRNAIRTNVAGTNIRLAKEKWHVGLTTIYYDFGNLNVNPTEKQYNIYYFRGKNNVNTSVDYKLRYKKLNFFGETAMSSNWKLATLNSLQYSPNSYCSFILTHRHYDKAYHAFYADAFSQSSGVINEQGVYLGMRFRPLAYWQVSAYADVYRYPWLRYGVDRPSDEQEYMVQLDCYKIKNTSLYVRYKYKNHANYDKQQLRIQGEYGLSDYIKLKTVVNGNIYENNKDGEITYGYMFSQSVGFNMKSFPLKLDVMAAWFDADTYQNRIYSYEKSILYAYNSNSFYGRGVRTSAVINYKPLKTLSISAKFGLTKYMDRETIGSNLEMINGSLKTDLLLLLGYKF